MISNKGVFLLDNLKVLGSKVSKIRQGNGSTIIITFGEKEPLWVFIELCDWILLFEDSIILDAEEPGSNVQVYRDALSNIAGSTLDEVSFEDEEILLSFSSGHKFSLFEDESGFYTPLDEWITFGESNTDSIAYSSQKGFYRKSVAE